MNKKTIISVLIAVVVLILAFVIIALPKFDNTTNNIVNEDKTKVALLVDETVTNNSVKATLSVENNNGFDINLLYISCDNPNINLDISNEGTYLIENGDSFSYDFTITFNQELENEDGLSLLKDSKILLSFNADAANQNDEITQIEPIITVRNSSNG